MRLVGSVVVILALSAGGWLGYGALAGSEKRDAFVVQALERGDIVQTVSATGTVEPLVKVIVGSQVSGTIRKWYADFNDKVTQDFVLAEIDPPRFQTAYEQAKADLALAKARQEELMVRAKDADRESRRILALYEQNNASENEMLLTKAAADAAKAVYDGAVASVQSAEARVNSTKVDLDNTFIRSPIDGVVISRDIDVGQTVAASFQTPQLFLIANDLSRMQVNANVSEADIGLISQGMPAQFRVDAYPLRTFTGTISQIRYNATVIDGVVTYVTLIEVHNDDLVLRPGMTANVTFQVAKAENVIRLPNAALRFDPAPPDPSSSPNKPRKKSRVPTVYVLEGDRPTPKEVKIGLSDGAFTQLVDGDLAEGAKVITERNWRAGGGRKPDMTQTLRRGT
ncbi:MAG TPA: efflux RND transporter periplasmic adaptor subunit [Phycisphaerae bacterium]|nr:efflux RND transporter periplasmic adaptor subunit [Phycisphaerae bacterium]